MKKGRLYNREEIELISQSAIGKSVNDILNQELVTLEDSNKNNKGGIGQFIEEYLFGIKNNNESEPDFMPEGIELKVTPYKKIKDGQLSAKERLVLNIIDYMTEYKNTFESSHFWYKNNTIQILWYLWEPNKNNKDFKITNEKLLELSKSKDLKQIKEDWYYIINKIREGKAHEISEADTMYLGACSKGTNSSSVRKQPFSEIPAMQRAFCFKNSYMTQLVRKYIGNYSDVEKILKNSDDSFSSFVEKVINKYKGKSQNELLEEFNINSNAKNVNSMLVSRMFNVKSNLRKTEEFLKAKIVPKTIRVEENGKIIQSISFPYFKFTEFIEQNWDNSDLKNELETTKYMFFIFKKEHGDYIFKGIKLWNMPINDIDTHVKDMWIKTYDIIKSGNIVRNIINGKRITNFVGKGDNPVCHVRPHGRNSKDVTKLPVADKYTGKDFYTKQCFWLNNDYVKEILKDLI